MCPATRFPMAFSPFPLIRPETLPELCSLLGPCPSRLITASPMESSPKAPLRPRVSSNSLMPLMSAPRPGLHPPISELGLTVPPSMSIVFLFDSSPAPLFVHYCPPPPSAPRDNGPTRNLLSSRREPLRSCKIFPPRLSPTGSSILPLLRTAPSRTGSSVAGHSSYSGKLWCSEPPRSQPIGDAAVWPVSSTPHRHLANRTFAALPSSSLGVFVPTSCQHAPPQRRHSVPDPH
jgi:hypothetical protein